MKGLLLKDIYTMVKQLKIFLLLIVILACLPGYYSVSAFAVVYAAMLPITAVAYDERSKWNRLAAMMPYSVQDLVLSKYVLGYLMIGAATLISVISQVVLAVVSGNGYGLEEVLELVVVVSIAVILLSVNLPLMFRFGVEKGRMAFIILTVVTVMLLFSLKDTVFAWLLSAQISGCVAIVSCIAATVLLNFASYLLSLKLYARKIA